MEELYDNGRDPHHIHNLASDPAHRSVLERMRRECVGWMERTGDLGLLPEYELELRSRASTPHDIATDVNVNPLRALLEAAQACNELNPANLPRLLMLLENPDAALRWWGAVGLVALGRDSKPAVAALRRALVDSSPDVRIAAAEAIAHLGEPAAALAVLRDALRHDAPVVRLAALNALDRLGANARPALPAIRAARLEGPGHVAEYVNRMVEYLPARIGESK
jgi:hypothetical protein